MGNITAFHKVRGLVTNSGQTLVPGDLVQAWNVLVRRAGIIEQRRGYSQPIENGPSANIVGMFEYDNLLWCVRGDDGFVLNCPDNINMATLPGSGLLALPVYNGAASDPSRTYTRSALMNGNCYLTSSTEVWALGTRHYLRPSGVPLALPVHSLVGVASATGFMANNTGVAYRVVWGIEDDSGNVIQGPPSGRAVVYNTGGGPQNVTLSFLVPQVITQHLRLAPAGSVANYYIYRTVVTSVSTGISSIPDPGDQMNLVYQSTYSAPPLAFANIVSYTDILPDGFTKGPDLYTNSGQGGIANANWPPPACEDLVDHKGVMLYARTQQMPVLKTTLIGNPPQWTIALCVVGGAGGNQVTLTLVGAPDLTLENLTLGPTPAADFISVIGNAGAGINGDFAIIAVTATTVTYVGVGAPPVAGAGGTVMIANLRINPAVIPGTHFYISYTGAAVPFPARPITLQNSLTVSQNIAATVADLAFAINTMSEQQNVAIPGDSAVDAPGALTITTSSSAWNASGIRIPLTLERLPIAMTPFNLTANTTYGTTCWYPAIGGTSTTALATPSSSTPGRLYYSKTYQPEAVPLGSYYDIGDAQIKLRRVVTTRDSAFIFKDDGLFRLSGDPNLGAVPVRFDNNIFLVGSNMVAVMHNTIYAVTTRGICEITENGVTWISGPIQDRIRLLMDWVANGDSAIFMQHCVANEKDGCVFFYMQFQPNVTNGYDKVFSYCYNAETQTWTQTYANGPHQYPGHYMRRGNGVTHSGAIHRHYWNASVQKGYPILRESTVFLEDDPGLNTAATGLPLPGDCYVATLGATPTSLAFINWEQTPAVGDAIYQLIGGVNYGWVITALNPPPIGLTLSPLGAAPPTPDLGGTYPDGPGTGLCFLAKAIPCAVEYASFDEGTLGTLKHWTSATVLLGQQSTATSSTVSMYTELSGSQVSPTAQVVAGDKSALRVLVPNASGTSMQRSRRLSLLYSHAQAFRYFFIEGIMYESLTNAATRETE